MTDRTLAKVVRLWLAPALTAFLAVAAGAVSINSNGAGGGDWTSAATWNPAQVPTTADTVTILPGDTVVMNAPDGQAGPTAVNGTLRFSRVVSSTLTMFGGNITVNSGGRLDMGTPLDPIPAGVRATLVLAHGIAGQRGLVVNHLGIFHTHGAPKVHVVDLERTAFVGQTFVMVAGENLGWEPGDEIIISETGYDFVDLTERRVVTAVSGAGPVQLDFAAPLTVTHERAAEAQGRVANLTRNVVVRSSGTLHQGGAGELGTSFVRNLSMRAGDFFAVNTEFAMIGGNFGVRGILFDGAGVRGEISSCTVRDGYDGLVMNQADGNTFINNVIYKSVRANMSLSFSNDNIISGNVIAGFFPTTSDLESIDVRGDRNIFSNNDIFSTINGLYLFGDDNILAGNRIFANRSIGLDITGSRNIIQSNHMWRNGSHGIYLNGFVGTKQNNRIRDNRFSFNSAGSIHVVGGGYNIISSNTFDGSVRMSAPGNVVFSNVFHTGSIESQFAGSLNTIYANRLESGGIQTHAFTVGDVVVGNHVSSSAASGLEIRGGPHTFIDNFSFGHTQFSLVSDSSCSVVTGGTLGYDPSGLPARSFGGEMDLSANGILNPSITLKGVRVNPATPMPRSEFNLEGRYAAIYNPDGEPGVLNVRGDLPLSTGRLTLDNALPLVPSTATAPVLHVGTGHSAAVCSVNANTTVDQLVTVERTGGIWMVNGSVSGPLGSFPGNLGGCSTGFPAGAPMFFMNFTNGPSTQESDLLTFAIMAGSKDAGVQKRLYVGPGAITRNGGKSQIVVAPAAGMELRGSPGQPVLIDIQGGDPYYTLRSSGAFTMVHAEMRNADSNGLQLTGAGPVELSSSTFDWMGVGITTCAYITARDLTSSTTFYNLGFHLSRSTAAADAAYNVRVQGADAGLGWHVATFRGPLGGELRDGDPNERVSWGQPLEQAAPAAVADLGAAAGPDYASIRVAWTSPGDDGNTGAIASGAFRIFYATSAAEAVNPSPYQAQVVLSTTAAPGSFHAHVLQGLMPGTTYHVRLWTEDDAANISPLSNPATAMPFHPDPLPPPAGAVAILDQITVAWAAPAVPPLAYQDRYEIFASSMSASGPFTFLAALPPGALSFPHTGLPLGTVFHYRVTMVDVAGAMSVPGTASAMTADGVPPPAVSSLAAAAGPSMGSILLEWLSPGDDNGKQLSAGAVYAVQKTTDLPSVIWSTAAAQILTVPPAATGTVEQQALAGQAGLLNHFRLWTRDASGNWSAPSNAASSFARESGPQAALAASGGLPVIPWNHIFAAAFDKPVQPATVDAAFGVRRVRDNLGQTVDEPVPGAVLFDGNNYRFTPDDPLRGNSLYQVTIATSVRDMQGNPMAATLTDTFLTMMNRAERNVFVDGGGARAEFAPGALAADGYVTAAPTPAGPAAAATDKLRRNTGDAYAQELPGSTVEMRTFDALGAPQDGTFSSEVTVGLSYPDLNGDGLVDGTFPPVRAETLRLYWLDEDRALWHPLPGSVVDTAAKRVSGRTPHFTAFAFFGQAATDLSRAHAFPVPHRAGQGPITFTALGQTTRVRIFTIDGKLAADLTESDGDGVLAWDTTGKDGGPLPSGTYRYLLTSGDEKKNGRLVIIR